MNASPVTWEHLVVYLEADAQQQMLILQHKWPGQTFPPYAAQALMPLLDFFGQQGWELVSIQPVIVEDNGDVMVHGSYGRGTHVYLCVFKRPIGSGASFG